VGSNRENGARPLFYNIRVNLQQGAIADVVPTGHNSVRCQLYFPLSYSYPAPERMSSIGGKAEKALLADPLI